MAQIGGSDARTKSRQAFLESSLRQATTGTKNKKRGRQANFMGIDLLQ